MDVGFGDGDLDLEQAIQKRQPRHDKGMTFAVPNLGRQGDFKGYKRQ